MTAAARSLLDFKARSGARFTHDEARLDVDVDAALGTHRSERERATRWLWTRHAVRDMITSISAPVVEPQPVVVDAQPETAPETGEKGAFQPALVDAQPEVVAKGLPLSPPLPPPPQTPPPPAPPRTPTCVSEGARAYEGCDQTPKAKPELELFPDAPPALPRRRTKRKPRPAPKAERRRPTEADAVRVYLAYPRKVGRRKAVEAILRALRRLAAEGVEEPTEFLLQRVAAFAAAGAGRAGRFTPHPATWFNQDRFADDPAEWARMDEPETRPAAFARPERPAISLGDLREPVTAKTMREACAALGIDEEDFYRKGQDWRGEALYKLTPEAYAAHSGVAAHSQARAGVAA